VRKAISLFFLFSLIFVLLGNSVSANDLPLITEESPDDDSIDIGLQPTCNVTISDNESGAVASHANWDSWGYDYLHTNVQPNCTPSPIENNILWSTNVTGNYDSYGSMCVHDGIVYVVGKDYDGPGDTYWGRDNVTALYLNNGTIKWEYEVGDDWGFDDTPAYYNGLLYVPTCGNKNKEDAQIICLYANNGTVKWNTSLPWITTGTGAPVIDSVNNLVIVESVGKLWGLYLNNGTIKYNTTLGGKTECSLAFYNGFVYSAVNSVNSLTCHWSINGTLKWTAATDIVWDAGPLIVPEYNAVYMVQNGGSDPGDVEVSAVNITTGEIFWNWSNNTDSARVATPAYYDGKLYCNLAGAVWCLNASTSAMSNATRELWNISTHDGGEYTSPALANGFLYYIAKNRYAKCIDITDGSEQWSHYMGSDSTFCGDAVVADGIFLSTLDDGKVYAFGNLEQYNTTLSNITVTFATNESGSWVNKQTNTSCTNGSYSWVFTDADEYDTEYWWRVYVNDSVNNVSQNFSFTTAAIVNTPPVLSNPAPANDSTGADIGSYLSVDVSDPDGDTTTFYFYSNASGAWVEYANSSCGNCTWGINAFVYDLFETQETLYYWSINLTDGTDWTNETYHFTTRGNTVPSISNIVPANKSTDWSISSKTFSFDINDTDGDYIVFNASLNVTGDYNAVVITDWKENGTYYLTASTLLPLTNYSFNISYGDYVIGGTGSPDDRYFQGWINETFWFVTGETPAVISPLDGMSIAASALFIAMVALSSMGIIVALIGKWQMT